MGEWVHPKDANSMATSGLSYRNDLVDTGRAISVLFGISEVRKLLYTFKFLNGLSFCPPVFFTPRDSPISNSRSFHSKCLAQPFAKTDSFYNSFFVSSTKLWNSLPSDIAHIDSISTFKSSLKSLFLL